jgi:hypothetical protein
MMDGPEKVPDQKVLNKSAGPWRVTPGHPVILTAPLGL